MFPSAIPGIHINLARLLDVLLSCKGCREGETFYHAPVNLGFQPIKLLALEPFEVEYQCCPDSIEQQVCVFLAMILRLHWQRNI